MEEGEHNLKISLMSPSGNHKPWDGQMTTPSIGDLTTLQQATQPPFLVTQIKTVLTVITILQEDNPMIVTTRAEETQSMAMHTL